MALVLHRHIGVSLIIIQLSSLSERDKRTVESEQIGLYNHVYLSPVQIRESNSSGKEVR